MNQEQLKALMEMNENNQKLEATFYETQKGLITIVKRGKLMFDECLKVGFSEEQAIKFIVGVLTGGTK